MQFISLLHAVFKKSLASGTGVIFKSLRFFLPNKAPARGLGSTQNSELEEQ